MRNFKKFLALVLAMLMVSACAVSVSAAIVDMDTVGESYVEAVSVMEGLKILVGDDKNNFNPKGTLTRAAAAKIVALIDLGAEGQNIDWTAATSDFTDVAATHWGNAYINYASQNGFVDGRGNKIFDPDANVTVAEALVIAVKLAGGRNACMTLDKENPVSFWATNWVSWAKDNGLAENVPTFNLTAACTREVFAQIAYNVLTDPLKKIAKDFIGGFQLIDILDKEILRVTSDTVIVDANDNGIVDDKGDYAIDRAALEAALGDSVAALVGCKISLRYSSVTNLIFNVSVNATTETYTYAEGAIKYAKDGDKTLYNKLVIDNITYDIHESAKDEDLAAGSIGSAIGKSNYIQVKLDDVVLKSTDTVDLPAYYKAVAYDDDTDGDFDRLVIDTYKVATIEYNTEKATDKVAFDTITWYDGGTFTNYVKHATEDKPADDVKAINYIGEKPADKDTPVLLHYEYNAGSELHDVEILEVAETVKGTVTGIGKAYVNLMVEDAVKKLDFAAEYKKIDNWTLNQTVSVYTIGGDYVNVTSASDSTMAVVVNSAVVTGGKAVVTGFDVNNNFNDITVTIAGIKSGKMYPTIGYQNTDTEENTDKEYNTTVSVGYMDGDKFVEQCRLLEGAILDLVKTEDGVYLTNIVTDNNGTADKEEDDFRKPARHIDTLGKAVEFKDGVHIAIKDGYVWENTENNTPVACKYVKSGAVIIEKVVDEEVKKENSGSYAEVTYNKLSAFSVRKNIVYSIIGSGEKPDDPITFVYISDNGAAAKDSSDVPSLAAGQAIVFVNDFEAYESTYSTSLYNAVNLMTGEKVSITDKSGKVAARAGAYYVVDANGVVVEATAGNWIGDYEVVVEHAGGGLIGTTKAQPIVKTVYDDNRVPTYMQKGDAVTYGINNITIYAAGVIVDDKVETKAASDILTKGTKINGAGATVEADVYAVADRLIIVLKESKT